MKSLSIVVFVFLFANKISYGQDFDKCWPLGFSYISVPGLNSNLVFTPSGIRIDTAYRNVKFGLTEASISDGQGNLMLYTNGCVIMNTLNDTMLFGDSISGSVCQTPICPTGGGTVTQGALILPAPRQSNLFYIFHEPCGPSANPSPVNLYYSMVDLTLDSGKGAVSSSNTLLHSGTLCDGSLTAVKHSNGIDWWIVLHEKYNDRFMRYLLSDSGISGPFFQNIGIIYNDDGHGNSRFSPDGSKYATSTQLGGIDLFDFDRCSGLFSNYQYIDLPDSLFLNYIEFSPNSSLLYSASYLVINQFDLNATNIQASGVQVAIFDGFTSNSAHTYFWMMQKGPDEKIYLSCASGSPYLHVIDLPNIIGTGCNVLQHSIEIPNRNLVLPNLTNYRLGAEDSLICDTTNSIIDFLIAGDQIVIFPNPASKIVSISTLEPNEIIENIEIYDQFGRRIVSEKGLTEINIQTISSGVFSVLVGTKKGRYFKKLVISERY